MKRSVLFLLPAILVFSAVFGCRFHRHTEESLPLPPAGDSGLVNGCYLQAEYGFSVPVPKGYVTYAPNPDDQAADDFDEWIRFADTKKEVMTRLMTQDLPDDGKLSTSDLKKTVEKVFEEGDYQVTGVGRTLQWSAGDDRWTVIPYDLKDAVKKEWRTWACALQHRDFIIWVRATLPLASAGKGAGDQVLASLKESLSATKWYCPVGSRGISLEHYELQKFDADFTKALASGSVNRTLAYFDETSPARYQWVDRFRKILGGAEPKGGEGADGPATLIVRGAGMVINGKHASIFYTIQKGKENTKVGFRLSRESRWNIVGLERTERR